MYQPTNPYPSEPGPTFAGQQRTVDALAAMAGMFGHLPTPNVMIYNVWTRLDLQLTDAASFEAWRAALEIAPAAVDLREHGGGHWLHAEGSYMGVHVRLTSHGIALASRCDAPAVAA